MRELFYTNKLFKLHTMTIQIPPKLVETNTLNLKPTTLLTRSEMWCQSQNTHFMTNNLKNNENYALKKQKLQGARLHIPQI